MDIEEFRQYCIQKKYVTEETPFGENALVFKVIGKMFALLSLKSPFWVNLKCDPEYAVELREKFNSVIPGYHMNKKHWNTVFLDGSIPNKMIFSLIDHSYELVIDKLPTKTKKNKNLLNSKYGNTKY